jgi:hypothetical protein
MGEGEGKRKFSSWHNPKRFRVDGYLDRVQIKREDVPTKSPSGPTLSHQILQITQN